MGWGAVSNGVRTNGKWSAQEKMLHINVLELKRILTVAHEGHAANKTVAANK